jgi:hypothetical protein
MGVIALALAKLSLVLLFKRITPKQMGLRAVVWLLPIVAIYTILSLALIAFQCQLPQPWILSPSRCSTHGNVYYPITISNMLTDALLAIWMLPIIRALHMKTHPKAVVMWLFGSRLIICVADIGRMVVIHRALQSEDQTRRSSCSLSVILYIFHKFVPGLSITNRIPGSQLLWAIMDQVVVHLSINHATLPRIQNFLSNLQIGPISVHMPASQSGMQTATARSDQPKERRSTGDKVEPTSHRAWNALRSHLTGTVSRKSSISEQPLRHEEDQGIELSTIVYTGKGGLEQRNGEHGRSAATSLSSDGLDRRGTRDQQGGVRVQKDVSVTYEHV